MWQQIKAAVDAQGKPVEAKSPVAFNLLEGQKVY
jgi:hypothetical protein